MTTNLNPLGSPVWAEWTATQGGRLTGVVPFLNDGDRFSETWQFYWPEARYAEVPKTDVYTWNSTLNELQHWGDSVTLGTMGTWWHAPDRIYHVRDWVWLGDKALALGVSYTPGAGVVHNVHLLSTAAPVAIPYPEPAEPPTSPGGVMQEDGHLRSLGSDKFAIFRGTYYGGNAGYVIAAIYQLVDGHLVELMPWTTLAHPNTWVMELIPTGERGGILVTLDSSGGTHLYGVEIAEALDSITFNALTLPSSLPRPSGGMGARRGTYWRTQDGVHVTYNYTVSYADEANGWKQAYGGFTFTAPDGVSDFSLSYADNPFGADGLAVQMISKNCFSNGNVLAISQCDADAHTSIYELDPGTNTVVATYPYTLTAAPGAIQAEPLSDVRGILAYTGPNAGGTSYSVTTHQFIQREVVQTLVGTATWDPPADNGGAGVDAYRVLNASDVVLHEGPDLHFALGSIEPDVAVRVQAHNSAGWGPLSAWSQYIPPA